VKQYQYIFGPVPSRRLGRSLGIDLVPSKTCTYDCIYCQLGLTTQKTIQRKAYVPLHVVLKEIKIKLKDPDPPAYITLSGSGEPTLHSGIGALIRDIKKITSIPMAVITNGSLLWMPEVRDALMPADVVLPSLDAGEDDLFQKVNRPHPDITFEKMVQGLISFREEYKGQIWLEILLVDDLSAIPGEVEKIARWVREIKPDRIHLNTATRPPAEKSAHAVPKEKLEELARLLGDSAEVTAEYRTEQPPPAPVKVSRSEIVAMLQRRPCTLQDIVEGLRIDRTEAMKYINELIQSCQIEAEQRGNAIYYKAGE
jgi:wyosine [tRNA(Phe)-imidazoG37] synthetase (radical SAM superfamily)